MDVAELVPFPWFPVYEEMTENTHNLSSRGMLDTIEEETSDGENKNEKWGAYDSLWSTESGSNTGSVIKIDIAPEPDNVSEREFICPPKRRKQDAYNNKNSRNDNEFNSNDMQSNNGCGDSYIDHYGKRHEQRLRFDEIGLDVFSDSDSLSYASLSRSSSLIQFESLEKQLQQGENQFFGSTPSLFTQINYDLPTANDNQHLHNINHKNNETKISFRNNHNLLSPSNNNVLVKTLNTNHNCDVHDEEEEEDEADGYVDEDNNGDADTDSSCYSSDETDISKDIKLNVSKPVICNLTKCVEKRKKQIYFRNNKNSFESLSEDSGYCDHSNAKLIKTIPNIIITSTSSFTSPISSKSVAVAAAATPSNNFVSTKNNWQLENLNLDKSMENLNKFSHIQNLSSISGGDSCSSDGSQSQKTRIKMKNNCSKIDTNVTTSTPTKRNDSKNIYDKHLKQTSEIRIQQILSASLPDLLPIEHFNSSNLNNSNNNFNIKTCDPFINNNHHNNKNKLDFGVISSVPENLNLLCESQGSLVIPGDIQSSVVGKKDNVNFCKFGNNKYSQVTKKQQNITASYANLTLLNYSDDYHNCNNINFYNNNNNINIPKNKNNKKMEFNSLLNEMTAHFDRNLSILNDQHKDYEPKFDLDDFDGDNDHYMKDYDNDDDYIPDIRNTKNTECTKTTITSNAKTPTLTINATTSAATVTSTAVTDNNKKKTFDQDPTNLTTCYAESLERCVFDVMEPQTSSSLLFMNKNQQQQYNNNNNSINLNKFNKSNKQQHHEFVASTPNLNYFINSEYNKSNQSLNRSSGSNGGVGGSGGGILITQSKTGLSKGVSFCPIVSEISWNDHSNTKNNSDLSLNNNHHHQQQLQLDTETHEHYEHEHEYDHENDYDEEKPNNNEIVQFENSDIERDNYIQVFNNNNKHQQRSSTAAAATAAVVVDSSLNKNINLTSNSLNTITGEDIVPVTVQQKLCVVNNTSPSNINIKNNNLKNNSAVNMNIINNNNNNNNNNNQQNVGGAVVTIKNDPQTSNIIHQKDNKSKFNIINNKHDGADKKSKGFFTRLSNFRFSFRNNKSKKNKNYPIKDNVSTNKNGGAIEDSINIENNSNLSATISNNNSNKRGYEASHTPKIDKDFIYIPLKGPSSNNQVTDLTTPTTVEINVDEIDSINNSFINNEQMQQMSPPDRMRLMMMNNNVNDNNNHVLIKKPPLPKQPPRVVGVCAKRQNKMAHVQNSKTPEIDANGINSGDANDYNNSSYSSSVDNPSINTNNNNNNSKYYSIISSNRFNNHSHNNRNHHHQHHHLHRNHNNTMCDQKVGLIETNLDTHETVISGKAQSLMELGGPDMDLRNLQNINCISSCVTTNEPVRPHKSMEFLLDKENHRTSLPPENQLQKSYDSNAALSEHQLRVQASLQRLNVPDWYKQYSSNQAKHADALLRKRNSDTGRWTALNSKTTSLSSLGSHRSDRSPIMLSPSAHSHHGQTGFSRWSTSHLNSNQTSPSSSTRGGSFTRGTLNSSIVLGHSSIGPSGSVCGGSAKYNNTASVRNSFRQPYMGWRSQEVLTQPRTPAERLASSVLAQKQKQQAAQPIETPEIQSSIKEVTSAIVHYVNDQTNKNSRSVSPSVCQCWLESSFVGTRPLESPQTPIIDNTFNQNNLSGHSTTNSANIRFEHNIRNTNNTAERPSPGSATLEDVLASLLGLPNDSHRPTGVTANNSNANGAIQPDKSQLQVEATSIRRYSEGYTPNKKVEDKIPPPRRISLDSCEFKNHEILKCRYPKCHSVAKDPESKKLFKSCHNCSHMYCSRDCRRAHWEKHRKACLHSRVSALCRSVLSTCKDDQNSLRQLSVLARKGYVAQGRGVVRLLFRSPENADMFIKNGFPFLGEVSYVRWPDLLPAEMGPELYSELLKLSTEYKFESKMLLYVAICVVSEAPGNSSTAPVKWERQLVSRCAKLKLCKSIMNDSRISSTITSNIKQKQNTNVLILSFNLLNIKTRDNREIVFHNIQHILKQKNVYLYKHFPDVFQKLESYVKNDDNNADTENNLMPITINPKDSVTGDSFVCIIMPNIKGENIKMESSSKCDENIQTIDVGSDKLIDLE